MVIALINGGEAKTITTRYHKVWPINFEYPKESLSTEYTGHIYFTDLAIQPLFYGDYVLVFGIDGIETNYFSNTTLSV